MSGDDKQNGENPTMYQPFIDGIRAISVIAIVIYHLAPNAIPNGFAGVDVFFVLSGFVVSASAAQNRHLPVWKFLARFYARRLARIVPTLAACLLATFVASVLFIPNAWLSNAHKVTGIAAFFGLSNMVLAQKAGSYFWPAADYNPFTQTWSLGVEEQFYLLFPFLFLAWLHRPKPSMVALCLLVIASFLCCVWLNSGGGIWAFYPIWSRFWQLGLGVCLFQALNAAGHSFATPSPNRGSLSLCAAIALLVLLFGLANTNRLSQLPAGLVPALAVAALLACQHGRHGGITHHLLTLGPLRYIGRISYSLYLWHWPIFVLFRWTLGLESTLSQALALALSLGVSALSYRWIEQPPRRTAKRYRPPQIICAALALLAIAGAMSVAIIKGQPFLSLSTVTRNRELWYPERPVPSSLTTTSCPVMTVADDAAPLATTYQRGKCEQKADYAQTIFVAGDSHSVAYKPMLMAFVANQGGQVHHYANGGCGLFTFRRISPTSREQACAQHSDATMRDILTRIQPGDVLFLPSLRLQRMVDQWHNRISRDAVLARMRSKGESDFRDKEERRATAFFQAIAERGAYLMLEAPPPVLATLPFRCSDWFNQNNPICRDAEIERAFLENLRAPVLEAFQRIAQTVPRVTIWDPVPILCDADSCSRSRDGKPLLFDGDHLTAHANALLLPDFTSRILSFQNRHPD